MSLQYDKKLVRILIVDDEDSIRDMLHMSLSDEGWSVDRAQNGLQALEKIKETPYHIVISDINMPEMSGVELLEQTKKVNPATEFLIMTSNASLETAIKAIHHGAYDYLHKPFDDLNVVNQKMNQVADRILLRQQNSELLKRLKKTNKDLKKLVDVSIQLNGILELEDFKKAVVSRIPVLFPTDEPFCGWLDFDGEQWAPLEGSHVEALVDLDQLEEKYPNRPRLRCFVLEYNGRPQSALVFEGRPNQLTELFLQEVSTCYLKVRAHQDVVSLANRDGLTKLYNHRYFQDRLKQELSQVRRQKAELSVIMIDVDHFKNYNDTNGHPAGDRLLIQLAEILNPSLSGEEKQSSGGSRVSDVVARYGGEEFVFILPFTNREGAMTKADRIRRAVEDFDFDHRDTQPLGKVTLSIGVGTFPEDGENEAELIAAADRALYCAKEQGRNQVRHFPEAKEFFKDRAGEEAEPINEDKFESSKADETQETEDDASKPTLASMLDTARQEAQAEQEEEPQLSSIATGEIRLDNEDDFDVDGLIAEIEKVEDQKAPRRDVPNEVGAADVALEDLGDDESASSTEKDVAQAEGSS